jgi:hypothetical protein
MSANDPSDQVPQRNEMTRWATSELAPQHLSSMTSTACSLGEAVKRLEQANWTRALARQTSNPQSPEPQQRFGRFRNFFGNALGLRTMTLSYWLGIFRHSLVIFRHS